MKYDIVSIGSATLDVFVTSDDFQIIDSDKVFTDKALMVPYGAKCEVSNLVAQSGGGGTNTSVGFARLGLKSAVIARTGHDFASQLILEELEKEKVDTGHLTQVKEDRTDYSTILVGPDGGRSILVFRGKTRVEEQLIDLSNLDPRWFYISSLEGNLSLLEKLVSFADKENIKVAINPGRKELEQKDKLTALLDRVDIVVLNREEAARLTGLNIADKAIYPAMAKLVKEVAVITDGKQGATLFTKEKKELTSSGFSVPVIDSTGAGDAFSCGFVAGQALGYDLEKSLKLASSNGASVVTKVGAKTGLLHQEEISSWLDKPLKMEWKK